MPDTTTTINMVNQLLTTEEGKMNDDDTCNRCRTTRVRRLTAVAAAARQLLNNVGDPDLRLVDLEQAVRKLDSHLQVADTPNTEQGRTPRQMAEASIHPDDYMEPEDYINGYITGYNAALTQDES